MVSIEWVDDDKYKKYKEDFKKDLIQKLEIENGLTVEKISWNVQIENGNFPIIIQIKNKSPISLFIDWYDLKDYSTKMKATEKETFLSKHRNNLMNQLN